MATFIIIAGIIIVVALACWRVDGLIRACRAQKLPNRPHSPLLNALTACKVPFARELKKGNVRIWRIACALHATRKQP